MDQIISNFVPYNNPYIIISWKVPEEMVENGFPVPQEIRSEILWNGNISLNYPTDISALEKYRISGDTSFTIKGWLFGDPTFPVNNIYYVNSNFYSVSGVDANMVALSESVFNYPLSSALVDDVEFVRLSAYPQITDFNYQLQT